MNRVLYKNFKRALLTLLVMFLASSVLSSCTLTTKDGALKVYDSENNLIVFNEAPQRVVVLEESLAHTWFLSGGSFVGITDDYDECNRIDIDDKIDSNEIIIVGTTHNPSASTIMSLMPDLIIYTSKKSTQKTLAKEFKENGYTLYCANVDNFNDYLFTLENFCILNNTVDTRYKTYGLDVKEEIDSIIDSVPNDKIIDIMFMRARNGAYDIYASGSFVSEMLDDLKCNNIAKDENGNEVGLDQPISLSYAVSKKPEYCFVTYMGASTQAKLDAINAQIDENIFNTTLWEETGLKANCKVIRLSDNRDLFQYKPNNRWAEAYRYLFNILYGNKEE